jgi:O-antigen biosynthesis protein WbqP
MNIKRFCDLLLCICLSLILIVPVVIIFILVKITSKGPGIYWSDRVGKNNQIFKMPKFRTMYIGTPEVASNNLINSDSFITPFGSFLRKSSLDELPQIWSVFKGDMSFVGPRPALFNQDDLIKLRNKSGVIILLPGLTGWAQINGRDELSISKKVALDIEYMQRQSFLFDLKILCLTFLQVVKQKDVSH